MKSFCAWFNHSINICRKNSAVSPAGLVSVARALMCACVCAHTYTHTEKNNSKELKPFVCPDPVYEGRHSAFLGRVSCEYVVFSVLSQSSNSPKRTGEQETRAGILRPPYRRARTDTAPHWAKSNSAVGQGCFHRATPRVLFGSEVGCVFPGGRKPATSAPMLTYSALVLQFLPFASQGQGGRDRADGRFSGCTGRLPGLLGVLVAVPHCLLGHRVLGYRYED